MFPDSPGKHQMIETAQLRKISPDMPYDAITEYVDGQLRPLISRVSRFLHIPQIIADARDA